MQMNSPRGLEVGRQLLAEYGTWDEVLRNSDRIDSYTVAVRRPVRMQPKEPRR